MPRALTVDDYVTGIIARELDPAQIETSTLQDLIACLEARQNPVCADACLDLIANAVRTLTIEHKGKNKFAPDCEPGTSTHSNIVYLADLVTDGHQVVARSVTEKAGNFRSNR